MKMSTFKIVAEHWKADKKQYVKKSTYAAYCLLLQSHLIPDLGQKYDVREECDRVRLLSRAAG